ncbi:MAG: SEC-C metal-binding domain-containing protein, partial [Solirubrobacteraceae bacterium]|jgi:preprotein translocase subunit SecA
MGASALAAAAAADPEAGAQAAMSGAGAQEEQPVAVVEQRTVDHEHQVGRNDPCWCGSGKKYKKCHGA